MFKGAWRLATLRFPQAICIWLSPSGSGVALGDIAGAGLATCFFLWMCMIYKALGDTLRTNFLKHFLSCGLE